MFLHWLASGDYTVRVAVWTDTGQTFNITQFILGLAMLSQNEFPGLTMTYEASLLNILF